jgi:hypothetical protein
VGAALTWVCLGLCGCRPHLGLSRSVWVPPSRCLGATLLQAAVEASRWELEAAVRKLEKEHKGLSAEVAKLTQANSALLEEAKNLKVQLTEASNGREASVATVNRCVAVSGRWLAPSCCAAGTPIGNRVWRRGSA